MHRLFITLISMAYVLPLCSMEQVQLSITELHAQYKRVYEGYVADLQQAAQRDPENGSLKNKLDNLQDYKDDIAPEAVAQLSDSEQVKQRLQAIQALHKELPTILTRRVKKQRRHAELKAKKMRPVEERFQEAVKDYERIYATLMANYEKALEEYKEDAERLKVLQDAQKTSKAALTIQVPVENGPTGEAGIQILDGEAKKVWDFIRHLGTLQSKWAEEDRQARPKLFLQPKTPPDSPRVAPSLNLGGEKTPTAAEAQWVKEQKELAEKKAAEQQAAGPHQAPARRFFTRKYITSCFIAALIAVVVYRIRCHRRGIL